MRNQSLAFDQWLVINDGQEPYTYTMQQEVVQRDPTNDTRHSIRENWLAALPLIRGDKVFVIEDDDWYHPDYLATLAPLLDSADLVGVNNAVYWKFRTRQFFGMMNTFHASLASTAFTAKVVPHVERIVRTFDSVFIDMYLWAEWGSENFPGTQHLISQPQGKHMLTVQMKNMPGAFGLGLGHQHVGGSFDRNFGKLRDWMGADASVYSRLWHKTFNQS